MPAAEAPVKPVAPKLRATVPVPPKPQMTDTVLETVAKGPPPHLANAVVGAGTPGEDTVQVSPEVAQVLSAPPELPAAQTPFDLEREVELRLHGQLQFISFYQPGTMTVNEFAEGNGFPDTGRRVLEQFIDNGWVEHTFRDHYGRYSLTPVGLEHLAALTTKYNL